MEELGISTRKEFPIFARNHGKEPFVYLDSAATSLKPKAMLDAMAEYYEEYSANVARGVYGIAERATAAYGDARKTVQEFIHASRPEEIIFVRNATEAINLVAASFAGSALKEGDGILLTEMEHHSNLVPWQQLAKKKKLHLFFIPFDSETGDLQWREYVSNSFLKERKIKLLSLTHVSNVLGVINPVKEIAASAHEAGVVVVVDACQSVPHVPMNVADMGADFLVFSGHKMLGPTGIGVLWGKYEHLVCMPPFLFGGEMILDVSLQTSTFLDPPARFEAGTPDIAGAIGLGAAARFLTELGLENIRNHERELMEYALLGLQSVAGLRILGPKEASARSGVIAFTIAGIHPHDVGSFLAEKGIMIRVGDHCAKPLHKKLGIAASSRLSFYLYNDKSDVDAVLVALQELIRIFNL